MTRMACSIKIMYILHIYENVCVYMGIISKYLTNFQKKKNRKLTS